MTDVPESKSRGWIWPVLVIALLGGQAVMLAVTFIIASSDPSVAVEPNYYEKALAWDEDRDRRRDPALDGFEISAELQPASDRNSKGALVVSVFRDGAPVEDAVIDAVIFHHARSGDRQTLSLLPQKPGVYVASADLRRDGNWEVRLSVQADRMSYLLTRQLELYGSAP
ncbi:MAG: hypothetical protein D6695_07365 [Planctomycetota bacterium]|nr:MAG: hypothetical protein D6695_07365 [Planctomycetota bacterium]